MLKLNKKLLPFILLGIISAAIFLYLQKNKESLSLLFNLTPYSICILVLCSLAVKLIIGFIYKVLMCFFDLKLVFKEWFGLTSISMMANYFLPAKGGLVALAVYLKKVHNFTYTMFLSSAAGFHGVSFLINAVVGIGLSAFVFRKEVLNAKILFVFFITIITVIYIVFLCIRYLSKLKKKWPLLQRFVDGFANFRKKPDLMFKLVLFQLALLMMAGVKLWFAFKFLAIDVTVVQCVIISAVTSISMLMSITPASLGIKELFIMLSSTAFGVSPAQGLVAAILVRAVDMIVSFTMGFMFTYILAKGKYFMTSNISNAKY